MIFEPLCLSSYSVLAGEGRSIRVGALSPEEIVQKFSSEGFLGASINDHFTLLGSIKASILSKKINFPFFLSTRIYLNEAPGVTIVCFPLTKAGLVSLNKFLSKSKLLNSNSVSTFVQTVRDVVVLLKLEELRNDTLKLIEVLRSYFFHIYTVRGPFEILPETKNAYKVKDLYSIPIVGSLDVAFFDSETLMLSDCLACILRNKSLDELTVNERFNFTGLFHKPRDYKFYFPPEVLANNLKLFNSLTPWLHLEITQIFPGIKSNTFDLNKYCRHKLSDLGLESDYHSVTLLEKELKLIKELDYEKFFVLCKYIVDFAKSRDILCQGRGAAANSIVCFLLGITVVHPKEIDFLLERFINRVRQEPPDIDIDFESDRRQEIFDFIFSRFYGRCSLISAVSTFQLKSAVRDIGRAFGIKASVLRELGKHVHYWVDDSIRPDTIKKITAVDEDTANLWLKLAKKLADFPRHLTQHVGGVLFHNRPIWELSPIYMSKDNSRIMIELTKDDVDDLGLVKVDILGLGMLSAIKESLNLLRRDGIQVDLASLRADDHKVFDLLCSGRTIGVFQVESRAQQAMICKLKPRSFYDLVIEVAIVRPGPIVGEVVHPYLRRRQGIEKIEFPSKKIEKILGKTLGVPLFQEQALRLAVEIANFSEEETEGLRKALKTFKPSDSLIEKFRSRLVSRLQEAGYSKHFAEQCANQIKGFSQYGFP
ncbi:MAG: hypothetical protein NZT61_02045, partial [Deltaproteobacteria bacterium]|nr:hypothetical protein [Deltaproteobacteria bacterium]